MFLRLLCFFSSLYIKTAQSARWGPAERRTAPPNRHSPVNLVEQWFGCGVSPSVPPRECAPGWLAGEDGCSAPFFFFLYFGEFYPDVTAPPRFRPSIARLIPFPYKECERQRAAKRSKKLEHGYNSDIPPVLWCTHGGPGHGGTVPLCVRAPWTRSHSGWKFIWTRSKCWFKNWMEEGREGRRKRLRCLRNSSRASTVLNYIRCKLYALHVFSTHWHELVGLLTRPNLVYVQCWFNSASSGRLYIFMTNVAFGKPRQSNFFDKTSKKRFLIHPVQTQK